MRKIPATMATQHPDNALAPYWDKKGDPFVSAYQEIEEAFNCFNDLDVSEYMWDWEGKHADAAVIDRMFSDYREYFTNNQLGRDKFLTFRIPNIWEEKGYNLLQAMVVILSAEDFARDLKLDHRPLFEVILPMTTRPEQLMRIHGLFEKLARFKNNDFTKKEPDNDDYLELIPLVESAGIQMEIDNFLTNYLKLYSEHFGRQPAYIRAFLACSDSALESGFLAALIGNKVGLSRLYEFQNKSNIPVFPIAGAGSLTFRGGLAPTDQSIQRFLKELPGVRTVTIQSAFRYDYALADVQKAVAKLEKELPTVRPKIVSQDDQQILINIANLAAKNYKEVLGEILSSMGPFFANIPKRRDRRLHIGLLGYGRTHGEYKIPRAITFTGAFYSIGVPPEFIGVGRTLQNLNDKQLEILKDNYGSISYDLERAGRFLNKENLKILAKQNSGWQKVVQDVQAAEKILGISFEPQTSNEKAHQQLSTKILNQDQNDESWGQLINEMAILRKSIG